MSILAAFENAPFFATGTDVHVTDGLDSLWASTRALDLATLRMREGMPGHAEHRIEFTRTNPLDWYAGGFRFEVGLTTLTITTYTGSLGTAVTPRLRVLLNGVQRGEFSLSAGLQTFTITISGLGFTAGQAVEALYQIVDTALVLEQAGSPDLPGEPANPSDPQWGRYDLVASYVSPVSATFTTPWPSEPTWTTTPTSALFTLLGSRANWLATRIGIIPWPIFQRPIYLPGLFWAPTTYHLWSGTVTRGAGANLVIEFGYQIVTNAAERFRLLINGAEVTTTAVLAAPARSGTGRWEVDITGYSASVPLRLEIQSLITTARDADEGGRPSRFSLVSVRVERGSSGHLTMPARTAPDESMTWATLRGRLQTLNSHLNAIKARIDAAPDLFERAHLYRAGYSYNESSRVYLQTRHIPTQYRRLGRRLVVHGKNVRIGWGPLAMLAPKEQDGELVLEYGQTETLTAADKVETREIWLDQLPGLQLGMTYALLGGDVRFAAEYLR